MHLTRRMRGMSRLGLLVMAMVFVLAGYLIAGPYLTTYQMQRAAEARDGEALSEHVDFPAVRQNLKDQFNAEVASSLGEAEEDNPFAALGAAFGSLMIDRVVDAFVTPAGIARMMEGDVPEPSPSSDDEPRRDREREPFSEASTAYEGFSKFAVTVHDEDTGDDIRFILRRRGFGWKLAEIWLPL